MGFWRNKVALITGGTAGFGAVLAREFAQQGAKVVIAARNQERLQQVKHSFCSDELDVTAVAADVTNQQHVDSLFEQVIEQHGKLDVLVNNVGRSTRSLVQETEPEQFQELMDVNFLSVVRCTRAALPSLVESKGHLVNIGSLSAKTVSPFLSAYAASKFAVAAYSQQLRLEGPREVHVLLVCPGPIKREDAGGRYDDQATDLPESARKPGGGARVKRICPHKLSRKIMRACERRKPELVVPGSARLLFAASQLWPSFGDWLLRRFT